MKVSFIRPLGTVPQTPAAVQGVVATVISSTEIDLTWTAIAGAQNYTVRIFGNPVVTLPVTNAQFTQLAPQTQYSFTVAAINTFGEGQQSTPVLATTQAALQPPDQVMGVVTNPVSTSEIDLSWGNTARATNYIVQRNGINITTVTGLTFNDTGLTQATTYQYNIIATNNAGNGLPSANAFGTTLAAESGTQMKWTGNTGWWMGSNAVLTNGRAWNDVHFTPEYSDLDTSSAATIGYRMFVTFAHIDPNNANGVDANYHWADIDAAMARIAPRKFAIQYNLGVFNNSTPARPNGSTDTIPSYMLNNTGTYGPGFPSGDPTGQGGYYEQQTGGYCANITNANVRAQVINSIQAMARRYDGNPQFAFIGLCEDSNMIPLSSTGLSGQFRAAWMSVYQAMRTAFTQTPTYAQATFQFDGQQSETVCEDMVARGVLQGTADTYGARYIGGIFTGSISGTTLTVTAVSNGTIYTNRGIDDLTGNLAAGQRIVSQLSGTTGGVGTYQVSISQTVASESMYGVITSSPPYNGMQWGFNCFTGTPFSVGGTPVTGILDRRPQSRAIIDVQDSSADQVRTQNVADLALALNLGWGAAVCFFSHITGRTGSAAWANWNTAMPLFASNPLTNNSYPTNLPQ